MLCKNFFDRMKRKLELGASICKPNIWQPVSSKTCKEFSKLSSKNPNSPIRKWSKDLKRQIHKVSALIKRSSTSLVLREMQNKTTISYHYISLRMATLKNSGSTKCWRGGGETGLLMCWWWGYKMAPATIENSLAVS